MFNIKATSTLQEKNYLGTHEISNQAVLTNRNNLTTKPGLTVIETTRQNYKMIAVLIATLGAGLPIWTQSVRQVDFTDPSFLGLWLFIGILAAFISLFFINLKMGDLVASFTIGYVLSVVTLFVGGILITNHIHDQLGIALAISMLTGIVSGFTGSVAWSWIKKQGKVSKRK